MSWSTTRLVEFQHCDPAGIVFYPRYFEMINSVIEEFFRDFVGYSFAPMHFTDHRGVPTVKVTVEFQAPGSLEDLLEFTLDLKRVGDRSITIAITCTCAGQPRFTAESVLVHMDLNSKKSIAWLDDVRQKLATT